MVKQKLTKTPKILENLYVFWKRQNWKIAPEKEQKP